MDPYLEGPAWESFHSLLATEITRSLSARLLPRYVVRPEKIYVMSAGPGDAADPSPTRRRPDVTVAVGEPAAAMSGGPAAALMDPPLRIPVAMPEVDPEPQWSVRITDPLDQTLVTAIELLSPSNKRGDGRRQYLAKRDRLLLSDAHLLEIDLTRSGRRPPMAEPMPVVSYVVVLSRADRRPLADVWPIPVRERLPAVPVPLTGGDPDVGLDLQAIVAAVYDVYGFGIGLNYDRPPTPPLPPADAAWAADLLARRDRR